MIFKCYSSEDLITLNTLHEVVPTWYSFHSWVDWRNADKVTCSRIKHIDAEVRTRDLCIQNRHSNHYANCSQLFNCWCNLAVVFNCVNLSISNGTILCSYIAWHQKNVLLHIVKLPRRSIFFIQLIMLAVRHYWGTCFDVGDRRRCQSW